MIPRRAQRRDANEKKIISQLRAVPGVSIMQCSEIDLIVGFKGHNFLFELKNPDTAFLADGITFKKGAIKESQSKIRRTWQGHYNIVTSLEQILEDINYDFR